MSIAHCSPLLIAAITLGIAITCPAQEVTSFYSRTSDDSVATISSSKWDPDAESSYFVDLCPGYGGYELLHSADDARSWIDVKFGDKRSALFTPTMEAAGGNFPAKDNDTVEWRGFMTPEGFYPYAIIYRIRVSDPNNDSRTFTRLLAVSLDEADSKILGAFDGEGANDEARDAADAYASGD